MDDDPELEQTATDLLAITADSLDALLALVVGYKQKAMDAGFSEYAAEEMCLQVHAKLMED